MASQDFQARFGANLKRIRQDQGLTQEHVAYNSGIAVSSLSKIENGHAGLNITKLPELAEVLGVKVADLFQDL